MLKVLTIKILIKSDISSDLAFFCHYWGGGGGRPNIEVSAQKWGGRHSQRDIKLGTPLRGV